MLSEDTDSIWELIHTKSQKEGRPETVFQLCSRLELPTWTFQNLVSHFIPYGAQHFTFSHLQHPRMQSEYHQGDSLHPAGELASKHAKS